MRKFLAAFSVVLALISLAHTKPAQAQAARTFVSGTGLDSNPCTRAAPCVSIQHAISQTTIGGEVSILDSADYGAVGITNNINIVAEGAEGGILVGSGININASVGTIVTLRGLVMEGGGANGNFGIQVSSVGELHVQNCVIRNFRQTNSGYGILFASSAANSQLFVSNTVITDNGTASSGGGIYVTPSANGGMTRVSLSHVELNGNGFGLKVFPGQGLAGPIRVTLSDSSVANSVTNGVWVSTNPGFPSSWLMVERSRIINNLGTGALADGANATVLLNGNTIYANDVGVNFANSGSIFSYNNNAINGSATSDGAVSFNIALH
jgi:hypothetical protein